MEPLPVLFRFLGRCLTFDRMSKHQLTGTKYHTYNVRRAQLIQPIMWDTVWGRMLKYVPLWMHGNVLTCAGLLINLITGALFLHHCPTATEEAPRWLYLYAGLAIFIYLTLDNLDGKQLLRTQCDDAVGELFDHAFDGVSNSLIAVSLACMLRLGEHPVLLVVFELATITIFYETHWLNYVTGYVYFKWIDVDEALLMYSLMLVATYALGPHIWMLQILGLGVYVRTAILAFGIVVFLACSVKTFYQIVNDPRPTTKRMSAGPVVADANRMTPGYPLALIIVLAGVVWISPGNQYIHQQRCIYMLIIGAAAAKIITQLIASHITKSAMRVPADAFVVLAFLLVHSLVGSPLDGPRLCPILLGMSFLNYGRYFILVASQIAEQNGVYMLTTPDKKTIKPTMDE